MMINNLLNHEPIENINTLEMILICITLVFVIGLGAWLLNELLIKPIKDYFKSHPWN